MYRQKNIYNGSVVVHGSNLALKNQKSRILMIYER